MKEKLSALIDGELHEDEAALHLGRLKIDAQLRQAWDTYHLIGDSLRGEGATEFSARVSARLAEEPTVLAPKRRAFSRRRAAWYSMSAAASAAAVGLVLMTALPGLNTETSPAQNVPAVAKAPPPVPQLPIASATLENYLLAHQPYSHSIALQGVAPYVRTVVEERNR